MNTLMILSAILIPTMLVASWKTIRYETDEYEMTRKLIVTSMGTFFLDMIGVAIVVIFNLP